MFQKVLIANRGEIAVRVIRACREMGIAAVAVYSDADKNAAHRLAANESVYIGESDPSQSYLNIERIIEAARKTNAQAIHPGYGFLAENPAFAEACEKAGITFIGPPAQVICDLGDKTLARRMMAKSGVAVIPGMDRPETDLNRLLETAEKLGYPVLIKAAAGGGGKGMRIVESKDQLFDACKSASREAADAFANGSIYIEKYLPRCRHVEIQILADAHGNVIHLLERECSIQRRHQKIIEESPSTALSPELRAEMGQAAVAAAKASGYVNAGTVEFLLDEKKRFYFLEVNTRLQVEHPVTEMITGIDIVRCQLEIAAGEKLSLSQKDISGRGHAIECRIYGEDPEKDFFPCPGKILFMQEPTGPGIRNDSGIYSGITVPVEYDPILAKLIVSAQTRELAVKRMADALSRYVILGIKTPISFLQDVIGSKAFQQGETYTDFIFKHFSGWKPALPHIHESCLAFAVCEQIKSRRPAAFSPAAGEFPTPWETLGNWRG